jgi:ribosome-associated translation inhibitor RaiA
MITAKGQGSDMYIAVNDLIDKLAAQLQRHEGKLRDRKRHPHDGE